MFTGWLVKVSALHLTSEIYNIRSKKIENKNINEQKYMVDSWFLNLKCIDTIGANITFLNVNE